MTELPGPLTPADCDLHDFAFMPLDVRRLRDSDLSSSETPECCWAAVLIWCASWHQTPAASIPDDDKWIADKAGYLARGRIDPHWKKVRAGALRGWIKCSDGRFYHPVVAEKANDAWVSKLKQRWRTEMERVRKANARNQPAPPQPIPTFEEFVSRLPSSSVPLQMPSLSRGTNEVVPRDTEPLSDGTSTDVPRMSHGFDVQGIGIGIGTERGTGIINSLESSGVVVGVISPYQARDINDDTEFLMHDRWTVLDASQFHENLFHSGIQFSEMHMTRFGNEFRSYWRATGEKHRQAEWEHKFLQRIHELWGREMKKIGDKFGEGP